MMWRPVPLSSIILLVLIGSCTNYELIDDSKSLVTEEHQLEGVLIAKDPDKKNVEREQFFNFRDNDGFSPSLILQSEGPLADPDTFHFTLDTLTRFIPTPESEHPPNGSERADLWEFTDENGYYEMKVFLSRKNLLSLYTNSVLHVRIEVDERSFYESEKEGSSVKEVRVRMRNKHFQKEASTPEFIQKGEGN